MLDLMRTEAGVWTSMNSVHLSDIHSRMVIKHTFRLEPSSPLRAMTAGSSTGVVR